MLKQLIRVLLGWSVGLVLGAFLLTSPVEAASTKQISTGVTTTGNGMVSFFLGEDGAIWFTSTRPGGNSSSLTTGNSANPFDQGSVGGPAACVSSGSCNGFALASALGPGCSTTGFACVGIYVKTPGPGTFVDSPTVQTAGPVANGPANIVVTGQDNNFWYTLFDSNDSGRKNDGIQRAGVPVADPFSLAQEALNTTGSGGGNGFVDQSALATQCNNVVRACVGIWARFPQ